MLLTSFDWAVVVLYGAVVLVVGLWFTRRAGTDAESYFLAGRSLPWWILGTSMVATTFSTDTPNLVTDIVRTGGVAGNWVWWAFALTGMLTVFFYAKLWRRSGVLTDVEFYELRYSGKEAAFLRGFRALYLGVLFNVMVMASVTLAAIKIGGVLLGIEPAVVVVILAALTLLYSATAGLWGVVATDLMLFAVAMIGAIAAAVVAVNHPDVGSLGELVRNPALDGSLNFLPDFSDTSTALAVFIVPIAIQWWSIWYPGSEPGGGGYLAQRMLAAKDEDNALKAVLWFNVAHYGVRPWPWILVALASIVVFPTLESIQVAFPDLPASIPLGHDLAYPAMLTFLPAGWLGLVVASLAAAYMSTISTHLNWGASYIVQDFWRRFVKPDATERQAVTAARVSTALLTVAMTLVALELETALETFNIILQIGAGTGLVFILRWFWWRINAWSEISAMVVSFAVAVWLRGGVGDLSWPVPDWNASTQLVAAVAMTTVVWLSVTLLTRPTDRDVLAAFHARIRPMGPGWTAVVGDAPGEEEESPTAAVAAWFLGVTAIYAALFATGSVLYGNAGAGLGLGTVAIVSAWLVLRLLPRIGLR